MQCDMCPLIFDSYPRIGIKFRTDQSSLEAPSAYSKGTFRKVITIFMHPIENCSNNHMNLHLISVPYATLTAAGVGAYGMDKGVLRSSVHEASPPNHPWSVLSTIYGD
jgi:hypothetical protein